MSRVAAPPVPAGEVSLGSTLGGYWHESELPFTSLVFLLPLVAAYEVGTRFLTAAARVGHDQQIIAFRLLRQFFALFGARGCHLPALAVVGTLLAWHVARNDRWTVRWQTLLGMGVESVVLLVPVLVLGYALAHYLPLAALTQRTRDDLIFGLGAGIYEEFVFRLILFTYLSLILRDAFDLRPATAGVCMVVLSGVLFSAYHYLSPYEGFRWPTFLFRTIAGVYFGVLFLVRGFGITAATHAAYDVVIVALSASAA